MTERHLGSCFCGTVRFTTTGTPEGMGYCHCESCRAWSAGPVNAFSLWTPEAVTITDGEEAIASYAKTPRSERCWCTRCGGHLFTRHPHWNLIDVYVATIPSLPFVPGVHVNHTEARLHLDDELPRFVDFPAELGGTGARVVG